MSKVNRYSPCPCGLKSLYSKCCGRYHDGAAIAENAEKLMRSRYSAYALDLADYVMETTHPDNPHYNNDQNAWKQDLHLFSTHTKFLFLEVLEFTDGDSLAYVTFRANLRQSDQDVSFTEKSSFVKENDRWFYRDAVANS